MKRRQILLSFALVVTAGASSPAAGRADDAALETEVRKRAAVVEEKLIAWRRDIHEHPELGDQESRTPKLIAEHLKSLKMEVRTKVARTGVVGLLKGGKPGPTIALRADMDALPVQEPPGLPFASKARALYFGREVSVMHACGHDAHSAMLMATAEVLAGMRDDLPGTVVFIFQPAEEGSALFRPSEGRSWGAKLMLEEGLFKELKPAAVFGLHVMPGKSGEISYRTGAAAASSDNLEITVTGKQGHGGMPWNTVDPITTSALVVSGLQTVVSRKANLTESPLVVTVGTINGGTGPNIVPESVAMTGTIRSYDEKARQQAHKDIKLAAEKTAEGAGAKAKVAISPMYDVTVNDAALVERMAPVLKRAADGKVAKAPLAGASEDFSFYAKEVPGLYVFLGVTPDGQDPATAAPNHNPNFFVDETALVVGTRTMSSLAVNFLNSEPKK
ncbi:amidohydrolase [Limnoglobus roseus]|uniref:Amidohydrolase n=1 Tax=Limnoglobus roseus TaxID=2598579 RepID=A0A5C1A724_9BACT|nr:amidohydrolase [Limnoglobus roseus]QEL14063.1 amidohydrolase [Limnoglobus roseus]